MRTTIILSLVFVIGCNFFVPFSFRNYEINRIDSCHVGAPMILTQIGEKGLTGKMFYGFESELVYCGVSTSTITLLHREYNSNPDVTLIRPAFSFPVQYDLAISHTITFRDFIIDILEATPSQIKFRVTNDLPVHRVELIKSVKVVGAQPEQNASPTFKDTLMNIIPALQRRLVELESTSGIKYQTYIAGESPTMYLISRTASDSTYSKISKAAVKSIVPLN